jgi:hypothetical protein
LVPEDIIICAPVYMPAEGIGNMQELVAVEPIQTLGDVADLAAHSGRDRNVREQLLRIAVEWNLDCDRLDQQSDACLRAIADFLQRSSSTAGAAAG